MWEQLLYLFIGAFLAIIGSVVQSVLAHKNERKAALLEKRERAYLNYINAMLSLKVDPRDGSLRFEKYSEKYTETEGELRLYGSKRAKNQIKKYQERLDVAWEIGDKNGAITEMDNIICYLRDELGIE